MPQSVPVAQVMINPTDWTLLRAHTPIKDAIAILRILSEEEKLERGHSTPLVLDDDYNLLGLIRLTDLLRSIRHLCDDPAGAGTLDQVVRPVSELVHPFPASVEPGDSILKALDIMLDHDVSLVPVIKEHKLVGIVQLGDIFHTVAALLIDEEEIDGRSWIDKYLHLQRGKNQNSSR
jgi:CBS domain-containing protein